MSLMYLTTEFADITHKDKEEKGITFEGFGGSDQRLYILSGDEAELNAWVNKNKKPCTLLTKEEAIEILETALAASKIVREEQLNKELTDIDKRTINIRTPGVLD